MLLVFPLSQNKPPDFVAKRVLADVAALHDVCRFSKLYLALLQVLYEMIANTYFPLGCSSRNRRWKQRQPLLLINHTRPPRYAIQLSKEQATTLLLLSKI